MRSKFKKNIDHKVFIAVMLVSLMLINCTISESSRSGRSGEIRVDLGIKGTSFGSVNQAAELLKLINANPGKASYAISYKTNVDTVVFGCDFDKNAIVRVHQRPDGHGTGESWQDHILDRLDSAANGGSLNDTKSGKIQGSFHRF